MAMYGDLPVYKATYDLLLSIFLFTKEFKREYKYTVGESLKKETLQDAKEHIEVVRLMIRLMKDLHQISLEKFVKINQAVENVSKQLAGWQKSVK
jgi:hypothetical protein